MSVSNDQHHWSPHGAFQYYDEEPSVTIGGKLLEFLLSLFSIYIHKHQEHDGKLDVMYLTAWVRFNADFYVASGVMERFHKYSCMHNEPVKALSLDFSQFLAALVTDQLGEADIVQVSPP